MNSKAIKRQLLAAIAMVLVAAIALGSSTYAWFAGQNSVTAEGMSVKVQGESGILIKSLDNASSTFSTTASAGQEGQPKALYAASTYDLGTWYHNTSEAANNAQAKQEKGSYTVIAENTTAYYVANKFAVRAASNNVPVENSDLAITAVTVTNSDGSDDSGEQNFINKAVRVGIKLTKKGVDDNYFIYAPKCDGGFQLTANYTATDEATSSTGGVYTYGTAKTLTEKQAPNGDTLTISDHIIPADDSLLEVTIYVWFEGEDENCKSANIDTTLHAMNISVTLEAKPSTTV